MLFNSFQFALLLCATLAALRIAPARANTGILLGASLLFYTLWIPIFSLLLLLEIGLNYALLRLIYAQRAPRLALAGTVAVTLGLLAWFKYAGFLSLPFADARYAEIFLPLGISFYSFQILGLSIDAFRKPEGEAPSLSRYALFVCFFPQLIAGPILRGHELLPQIASGGTRNGERTRRGIWLFVAGLVKKVVFADFLLAAFVESTFSHAGSAPAAFHWIAMYSFAFQIYFDFSGYTDMARGAALLLGYELPENFREPYLALNPTEFWRGWHITLTSWFRDYVYLPMGLSGFGRHHLHAVLLLTWALVGLWHGPSWTFVGWGLVHGALLSLHRAARPWLVRIKPRHTLTRVGWIAVRWLFTFHAICFALVLFRIESLEHAARYFSGLTAFGPLPNTGFPLLAAAIVLACLGLHAFERWLRTRLPRWQAAAALRSWAAPIEGLAIGLLVGLAIAASGSGQDFIYFQF